MSHLQHINAFKLELIGKGVTRPEDQIGLTRTAYTCAFVRFFTAHQIPEKDQNYIMNYMLNYWNETFPINGHFVMASVRSFFMRLYSEINRIKGMMIIDITKDKVVEVYPDYYSLPTYDDLVKTLVLEIEHKYPQIKGA